MRKIIMLSLYVICVLPVFSETVQYPIRQEIKTYIDDLDGSTILTFGHTTDNISIPAKRLPDLPKPFDAGRYNVVFLKNKNKKAMIFQTESKVGHLFPVTPGETDTGGYVEILENPETDYNTDITAETQNKITASDKLKLNDDELEYLIRILYKNFNRPLTETESENLNRVKDFALSIYFSNKNGLIEYHNKLKTSNH